MGSGSCDYPQGKKTTFYQKLGTVEPFYKKTQNSALYNNRYSKN